MSIRVIYRGNPPGFPASDQHPDAVRYGPIVVEGESYFVDAVGGEPTVQEIQQVLSPSPVAAEPGTTAPHLIASALNITVADGDVAAVDGVFGLAAAAYLGTGFYMLVFLAAQPDADYFAVINGGAPCMAMSEKGVDYLMIEAKAAVGGAAVDPDQFSVQIFRI
jgi:hypothetical protein